MTKCRQCLKDFQEPLPVVIVMNVSDVMKLDDTTGIQVPPVGVDPSGKWAALGVCTDCHQQPTLKGHFFMWADAKLALRLVDMSDIRMPGGGR